MDNEKDFQRNRPAEKGHQNDPNLRDEDARQGASTMSGSETDRGRESLTETTSDNFRQESDGDEKADKRFDQ